VFSPTPISWLYFQPDFLDSYDSRKQAAFRAQQGAARILTLLGIECDEKSRGKIRFLQASREERANYANLRIKIGILVENKGRNAKEQRT
jgi:hypothetical protein